MMYIRLYDSADDPLTLKRQLGIGVLVEYVQGELGALIHVLRFLKKYAVEHNLADDTLPKVVANNTYVSTDDCLRVTMATTSAGGDIVTPIHIYFYHEHQLIFHAYTEKLTEKPPADENDEASDEEREEEDRKSKLVEYILAHYRAIERDFFPRLQSTH